MCKPVEAARLEVAIKKLTAIGKRNAESAAPLTYRDEPREGGASASLHSGNVNRKADRQLATLTSRSTSSRTDISKAKLCHRNGDSARPPRGL